MSVAAQLDPANVVDIDLAGAEFKANARRYLAQWAQRPPFYVVERDLVHVVVGRYADVREVFEDPERFTSELPHEPGYEQFDKFMGSRFITQMDGEAHARLRRLLMPAFSARRLAQMEERIEEIVNTLLDDIEHGGRKFDAMGQYAAQLVVGVLMTAMLNLDGTQRRILLDFQETQPALTSLKPGEPFPPECVAANARVVELVRQVIDERRTHPRSDFLGDLVAARDHDDRLSDKELFDQINGLFGAIATTPRASSGALLEIYSHPDQLNQLKAEPSLIPEAIEECLRLAGNGYFTFPRFATRDTQVGGTSIRKGMVVRASPLAANYDPTVFADPLRFDIHRRPKRIMTFGAGPHHCIGNLLGRATIAIAVRRMIARLPDARLADPDFRPAYGGAAGELRMKSLPMLRW